MKVNKVLFVLIFAITLLTLGTTSQSEPLPPLSDNEDEIDVTQFDHLATGFPLEGEHRVIDCESCHTGGVFEELSTICSVCHDGNFATGQSSNHIPTSENCDVCHTPIGFQVSAMTGMDHTAIGTIVCSSCHNNVTAVGKNAGHLPTTLECDSCHDTNSWGVSVFDHSAVAGQPCFDCHNNTVTTGKSVTHINTTNLCEACHTVTVWVPANSVDHSQVVGECIACHNNDVSSGKTQAHIPTTDNCGACHATSVWNPVTTVDHTQVIGDCFDCHNNILAIGKNDSHIESSNTCDSCHNVSAWIPATQVDHTQVSGTCVSCHDGIVAGGKNPTHIETSNDCAACHATANWVPATTVDHTQTIGACVDCHNGEIATGQGPNHIITAEACDVCHTTANWLVPTFDHTAVAGQACFDCHEGMLATGKGTTHIDTSNLCEACHNTSVWSPVDPLVDHAQVIGTCESCHDNVIAIGKGVNHIPTAEPCDTCHTTTDWLVGTFDHSLTTEPCTACHDGVAATGKSAAHINTTDLCEACHISTTVWIPVAVANVDHTQVIGTCVSCHDGNISPGKSVNHINTTDACEACHQPGPTPWIPVANADVDHTEVIGVCSSCHDNVIATGQGPTHVPTPDECDTCHTVGAWIPAVVDHTPFVDNCISCHDGIAASGKGPTHINSTDQCHLCHEKAPLLWTPVSPTAVDHTQVIGTCISCHDTVIASGKSANHISTSDLCDACHQPGPTPWVPVVSSAVDHAQVIGTCVSCHDGIIASGRSASHINTSDACEACHQAGPTPWTPVTNAAVNHNEVVGSCISCHDGIVASGKSATHINTTDVCDACHLTAPGLWTPVANSAVDHNEVIGACATCHDNVIATGQGPTHIPTTNNCDTCHNVTAWAPVVAVDHSTFVDNCVSCHDGIAASGKGPTHINSTDQCHLCHEVAPALWTPVAPAAVNHTQVTGSCVSCHDGVIASGRSATHINTSDACDACHQPGPTPWSPVANGDVDHTQVVGTCLSCHDGIIASGRSASHINTTDVCEACHEVPPQTWQPLPPSATDHTQVIGTCESCHDGVIARGMGVNHVVTTELCDVCHTTDNWLVNFDHATVAGQACFECHDGIIATGQNAATHINTTNLCEACHQPGPTPWVPVAPAAVDHNEVIGVCSSCHNNVIATGQGPTHIPTADECDTCHTVGAWVPAVVDHTPFVDNCISCHDGTLASGKGLTHINTSDQCHLCHEAAPALWTPVAPAAVDHSQVIGTCISCHDGAIASGKSATHINTSDVCDACHQPGPVPWIPVANADVNHNEVIGVCSSCHDNVIATGMGPTHVPTTEECDTCHTVDTWLTAVVDHGPIIDNCISCHDGTLASGKGATHIISSDQCELCHEKAPALWTPVAPAAVDHTQVVGTCISCHDGTIASGKSATHINSTDSCDACHQPGPTPWIPVANADVDHNEVIGVCSSCHDNSIATGKGPTHLVTTEECDICHTVGAWIPATVDHTPIIDNCISCHDGVAASGKGATHINSSNQCELCHEKAPALWTPVAPAAVDHSQVIGTCVSCHDGTIASGRSATHITTTDSCDACHQPGPTPWVPVANANVDHTQVVGTCLSCHDGVIASGRSVNHINTTDVCEACHGVPPQTWQPLPPSATDHAQVIGTCESCHDGVIARGMGVNHVVTAEPCDVCHSTTSWLVTFDHATVAGQPCFDCHDGVIATGQNAATHINTTNLCEACHQPGPTPWVPVDPAAVDHAQVIGVCSSCHDNVSATGMGPTHIPTTDECDVCHNVGAWIPATVDHTPFVDNCVSCHDGVIASGKSATHINTTDQCHLCHEAAPALWTPVAPATVDHTQVIGTCASCHDGTIASGKSATHINTSDLCDACHQPGPTPWVPVVSSAVNHAEVTGTCFSCHDGTIASGKSATHITTSDNCETCHQPGPTPWIPVANTAVDHNEVTGSCISCHDGNIASGKSATHINSSDVCEACHQPGPTPWIPVTNNAVDHNEVVGTCSSCHDNVIATGMGPTHIPVTQECDACHSVGAWIPVSTVDHSTITTNCISCHDGTTASGKTAAHLNTSDNCELCHAVFPATWVPVAATAVDHNEVIGICASCHNGTLASGKSTTHINTTNTCDACHQPGPTPWVPVQITAVDHGHVIGTCASCHDGTVASGKSATHISSTNACDACHAAGPTPWVPVANSAVNHNEVLGVCSSCHDNVIATGKGPTHLVTTGECDTCHTVGAWVPATVDHTLIIDNCVSCHDGVSASGKGPTHINSTDQCHLCHEKAPATWTPVAVTNVDHSQVIGTCASCHDGVIASGRSATHIATTDLCEACHQPGPIPWAPVTNASVDHAQVLGTCISCHDNVIASGKSPSHIASSDLCESCHLVPPNSWLTIAPAAVDHTQVVGTCVSCHDGIIATGKSGTHINTTNLCEACHAIDPLVWVPVAPSAVDHTQVIGTCSSCHNNSVAQGKTPTHIVTTQECDNCHTTDVWIPAEVDHTPFTTNCTTCHNGVISSGKSATHINSTDRCELCHEKRPLPWVPVPANAVDHTQVIGICASCHNGTIASGKSINHINSSNTCDACHQPGPVPWTPLAASAVDHTHVVGTCASCHDGVIASGKSVNHIASSDLCDACHLPGPTPWIPVASNSVDHNQVIGSCASCHDGVQASGKSVNHINSTDVCEACHLPGPTPWIPVANSAVDHNQVIGVCSSCHDNVIAQGMGPTHIPTTLECDNCHITTNWLTVSTPDHTGFVNNCITCHDGTTASGKSINHINTSDTCDACHAVFPAAWVPVPAVAVDHAQVVGTCFSCHNGTTASGKSVNHINTSNTCDACHQPGPTPWTPVQTTAVDHTQVIGTCVSCHNGTIASGKSINHINTTDFCDACHLPGPTPWTPVANNAVDHAQVLGVCSSCHDNVIAQGQGPTHVQTTLECDNCHNTADWLQISTVDHTGFVNNCFSCHNGTTASGKSVNHINTSNTCDACHAVFPALWTPVASAAVDHTQVIGTCFSCHNGTTASGKSVNHINTTNTCDACHQPGPTPWTPVQTTAVDHTQVIGTCVSCHNGTTASGKSINHINTTDLCDTCHLPGPTPWVPVANNAVDHAQVLGVCSSCHDNVIAQGKGAGHIQTTLECDNCHNTTDWLQVTSVDHTGFVNNCFTCHDGTTASGKSVNHINTSNTCDACHAVFPALWTPVVSNAVDHNDVIGTCFSCHNGTTASGKSVNHINTSNTCDACHQPGPTPWTPVASIAVDHTHVIGTCFSCHNGTTASGKSVNHINTTNTCDACHQPGPTPWMPVQTTAVDHTQVIGTCVSCHNGTTASGKSINHINSTDFCDACHLPGPTPWTPVANNAVDHAQVLGVCSSCHDNVIAQGQGPTHVQTTLECDNCHNTTDWLQISTVDHAGFVNNCFTCHNGTTASGKSSNHINTTNTCDACHAVFPALWTPVASNAVDHNEVIGTCFICHNGTTASGKSANHINSSNTCDACHQPGPTPWTPVQANAVDHGHVIGTCVSCHNNVLASGKSASHINSTDVCDACHQAGPTPWVPVANSAVDHNEVIGVCSSCHNNVIAQGQGPTHVQTTLECDNCHNTTDWLQISTVDHTGFVNNCFSCHNGTTASGKSGNHINTTNTCDACHAVFPALWTPVASAAVDHTQVIGTCFSCHNGTTASGKSVNHINTSNTCDACHQPGPTPWAPVAANAVDHGNVIGTCISCHNGITASGKSFNHINSTDLCDACHLPGPTPWTPVASTAVDHNQVLGICFSCHNGSTASGKSASHINTTNTCDACHLPGPTPWAPVANSAVDHNEVIGTCTSCHDNVIAQGKPGGHIQTTLECDNCHNTTNWLQITTVDHTGFVNNCFSCHNGTTASGKSGNHINTTNTCDACHAVFPATWAPVANSAVDHTQVIGTCFSCHNGTTAGGKSGNHINSTNTCDACHQPGPTPWAPVQANAVDHSNVIGTCVSCHNNVIALGKPGNHPNTTDNCDACHQTAPNNWLPFISPLNHNEVIGSCFSCHNGTIATGKSGNHPNTTNLCEACHQVPPTAWTSFITPLDHNEVIGTCVSCHNNIIAQGKPGNHPNTTDNCDSCHRVPPNSWLPFISPLDHNEVIGTCVSCHNNIIAQGKPGNHPNTTDNCDSCHRVPPNSWLPFISPLDHNEVIGTCFSCHNGTVAQGKPGNHPNTTNLCEACHSVPPIQWANVITPLDHTQVIGTCVSCHDGIVATGKPGNHPNTSNVCEACHSIPPTPWVNFITPLDHNEVIGTCFSCHDGGIATGKPGNHPNTTNACEACHLVPPSSFANLISPIDHNEVIGTCFSCHNGTIATGKSAGHPNTSNVCEACHRVPPTNWTNFITPLDHNEVIGSCVSCHNNVIAQGKPGNHPNTTDVCDACHRVPPATWLPFISPLDHSEVLGVCVSCHDGGIAGGKPGNHPLTSDVCEACHMIPPAIWANLITPLDHSQVLGSCVSCHDGGIATGKSAAHPNTTDLCDNCHRVPPTAWTNVAGTFSHTDAFDLCTFCHDGGIAQGKPVGHCEPAGECSDCHVTTSWTAGNPPDCPTPPPPPGVPPPPPGVPPPPPGFPPPVPPPAPPPPVPPPPPPAPPPPPPPMGMGGMGGM